MKNKGRENWRRSEESRDVGNFETLGGIGITGRSRFEIFKNGPISAFLYYSQYVNVKVKISEWQKEKLQHALKANCPMVTIRLDHEDLNGNDILAVTKSQAKN